MNTPYPQSGSLFEKGRHIISHPLQSMWQMCSYPFRLIVSGAREDMRKVFY